MRRTACLVASAALLVGACSTDEDGDGASTSEPDESTPSTNADAPPEPVLFSPEGNNLWAYGTAPAESDPPHFAQQLVNRSNDEDPEGWDINGQVCTLPDGRMITGEDTHQPDPPAGWGVFEVTGDAVGDLGVERVARLVPSFPTDDEEPDTYGCGVLSDGRVVTTTIGNNALGPGNGQLVLWFPPFDSPDGSTTTFCILADDIATAQQIWIDGDDRIYVASARPPTSGIWRYAAPEVTDADHCEPQTGEQLIAPAEDNGLVSPNGVVGTDVGDGAIFVSSIINGVIAEFDLEGRFRRFVLEPPAGEELGADPFSTGTPLGITLDSVGSLYYADLGLVWPPGQELPGPAPGRGSVRRIPFVDGEPGTVELINDGLTFPDSLGVWTPPA